MLEDCELEADAVETVKELVVELFSLGSFTFEERQPSSECDVTHCVCTGWSDTRVPRKQLREQA